MMDLLAKEPYKVMFDMDGVVANFYAGLGGKRADYYDCSEMYGVGFFENLPVIAGALVFVREIARHNDVWFLTQPVKDSAHSYSEKVTWVNKHFPEMSGKITMTQDKSLLAGDRRVLIDDNEAKWRNGWVQGGGSFIHFDERITPEENWIKIMHELNLIKGIL
jgi:5'(3')-deoxyribonucleotidase